MKDTKKAFTIVELIIVMVIMGVLVAVLMPTIKPAQYKEQALEALANKTLAEIQDATTKIMLLDSPNNSLNKIINPDSGGLLSSNGATQTDRIKYLNALEKLYKKYLVTTRKNIQNTVTCSPVYPYAGSDSNLRSFKLKNDACVMLRYDTNGVVELVNFPGQDKFTKIVPDNVPNYDKYVIYIDTNGKTEPNQYGKDMFILLLGHRGIIYNIEGTSCNFNTICSTL